MLTQKRGASSAASPELARCRGKRFVDMAEPDRGNRINIGLMKELTGGDKFLVRQLYKEPFELKPQFKIVLCCNDLPKVPPDDEGTWRRLRVVKFISKFTANPRRENEFPIDPYLADNFERWKEPFMYMLLQYHEIYKTKGIKEPAEVMKATKDYQKMADVYEDFLNDVIVKGNDNDLITPEDFFIKFKMWYAQNYGTSGQPNMKIFRSNLERKLGDFTGFGGWKGIKIRIPRDPFATDAEEDDQEPVDLNNLPGATRMAIEQPIEEPVNEEPTLDQQITYFDTPRTQSNSKFRMKMTSRSHSRSISRTEENTVEEGGEGFDYNIGNIEGDLDRSRQNSRSRTRLRLMSREVSRSEERTSDRDEEPQSKLKLKLKNPVK